MQINELHTRFGTKSDAELLGYLANYIGEYYLQKDKKLFELTVVCDGNEHTIVAKTILEAFVKAIILETEENE